MAQNITDPIFHNEAKALAHIEASRWDGAPHCGHCGSLRVRRLEGQMRSLSPTATSRIQAAIQAMEATGEYGGAGNYQLAESSSSVAKPSASGSAAATRLKPWP